VGWIVRGDCPSRAVDLSAPNHGARDQFADHRGVSNPHDELVPRAIPAVLPSSVSVVLAVLGHARPSRHTGLGLESKHVGQLHRCLRPLADLGERSGSRLLDGFDHER
jgi:hypothetical protein